MPKGQTRHWRKRVAMTSRTWDDMIDEPNARQRIEQESPLGVRVLDILAGHTKPFTDGEGWTVFNDWLDRAYRSRYYAGSPVPSGILLPDQTTMRQLVFPTGRDRNFRAP